MGAEIWLVRDSNWSPDFGESSLVARALMAQDQGLATDGAVAIDMEAVRLLVGALGSLHIAGIAEPVTADNVIDWMKRSWEAPTATAAMVEEQTNVEWWLRRKDFMGELVGAALAKMESGGSGLDVGALARAMLAMLDRRHLQIAVDDPGLAKMLADRGWDGAIRPPANSDFLAVIDSNVGFNKANAAVQQQLAYRIEPVANGLDAILQITYTHRAPVGAEPLCDRTARYGDSYEALVFRCYWDYLRVYVPGGSELVDAAGLNRVTAEAGERHTTVFAGDLVLHPGDQTTVILRYRLPPGLSDDPYRLVVRKQAGTYAVPLDVNTGVCRWQTDLAQDRLLECAALR
jgi:hypothetical protein